MIYNDVFLIRATNRLASISLALCHDPICLLLSDGSNRENNGVIYGKLKTMHKIS